MRRRTFIAALGGAAAWPVVARAQQPVMLVIGILATDSAEANSARLRAFRDGLAATAYVEGQNVNIEYRWAEAHTGTGAATTWPADDARQHALARRPSPDRVLP
jgi:putative ABC transport system substrate-binding protein